MDHDHAGQRLRGIARHREETDEIAPLRFAVGELLLEHRHFRRLLGDRRRRRRVVRVLRGGSLRPRPPRRSGGGTARLRRRLAAAARASTATAASDAQNFDQQIRPASHRANSNTRPTPLECTLANALERRAHGRRAPARLPVAADDGAVHQRQRDTRECNSIPSNGDQPHL